MALPEYAGFSLQDNNYVTEDITYRTWPSRDTTTKPISRKPGVKLLAEEFGERRIRLSGYILGSDPSDLRTKIDDMNIQLQKASSALKIETNRTYTATCTYISIADPHYAQDFVPYEAEFLCADPFSYGDETTATITIASGTTIQTFTTTISGSYFAEPTFRYESPTATGTTTTSGIRLEVSNSGEYADWDGDDNGTAIDYSSSMTFDFKTYKILQATTQRNHTGVFSRWEPGSQSFKITFGGGVVGGTLKIAYSPRYL